LHDVAVARTHRTNALAAEPVPVDAFIASFRAPLPQAILSPTCHGCKHSPVITYGPCRRTPRTTHLYCCNCVLSRGHGHGSDLSHSGYNFRGTRRRSDACRVLDHRLRNTARALRSWSAKKIGCVRMQLFETREIIGQLDKAQDSSIVFMGRLKNKFYLVDFSKSKTKIETYLVAKSNMGWL
jgi:hypothetical protein